MLISPSQNFARSCSSILRVWEIGRDCRAVLKLFSALLFLHNSPKFPFSKTTTKLDSLQPLKPKWLFPNTSCPPQNLSYNHALCPLHGWAAFRLLLGGKPWFTRVCICLLTYKFQFVLLVHFRCVCYPRVFMRVFFCISVSTLQRMSKICTSSCSDFVLIEETRWHKEWKCFTIFFRWFFFFSYNYLTFVCFQHSIWKPLFSFDFQVHQTWRIRKKSPIC